MFRHEKNLRPNFKEAVFGVHVCLLWIWGHIYLTKKTSFPDQDPMASHFLAWFLRPWFALIYPTTNANSLNLFLGGIRYFLDLDVGCWGWVCLCIWGFSWNIPTKSPADLQFHLIFVLRHSTLWQALSTVNIDIEDQTYKMHVMKSRLGRYKMLEQPPVVGDHEEV